MILVDFASFNFFNNINCLWKVAQANGSISSLQATEIITSLLAGVLLLRIYWYSLTAQEFEDFYESFY